MTHNFRKQVNSYNTIIISYYNIYTHNTSINVNPKRSITKYIQLLQREKAKRSISLDFVLIKAAGQSAPRPRGSLLSRYKKPPNDTRRRRQRRLFHFKRIT